MEFSFTLDNAIKLFLGGGAVILGLVIGGLLLRGNRKQRRAEIYLGLLIIAYTLMLFNMLLAEAGIMSRFQYLYFLPLYYTLSFGPLTYFFIKSKLSPGFTVKKTNALHAVLPLLQACFYFAIGFRSVDYKSELWRTFIAPFYQNFEATVYWVSFSIYLWFSFRLLKDNRAENPWKIQQLKWMRTLLFYLSIPFVIVVIYGIVNFVLWEYYQINLYNIAWLDFPKNIVVIFTGYWLCFNGFVQLYPEKVRLITSGTSIHPEKNTQEKAEELLQFMKEHKPYLNPDLNLNMLAEVMHIRPTFLSAVINENFQNNFNDFINTYRVNAVKNLIKDPKNNRFTLLSLGLEAGFNSKSTFNRSFKAVEGISPNEFKSKYLNGVK